MCKAEFGIHNSGLSNKKFTMIGDTNNSHDSKQYTTITADNFNEYLQNKYQPNDMINIGLQPQKPNVEIKRRYGRIVEFTTTQMTQDSGHYKYKYSTLYVLFDSDE